jgi:hypothetical protein
MLYGSCLHGYTPYTRGLLSSLTEWIIRQIAHKRKLANPFILFKTMNTFSYRILLIIHAYNVAISWLRLEAMALVVCLTPVGRRDSGCMPDSSRKTWLQSYARLRSEDVTLVVCPTPVERCDSCLISRFWSHFLTPVDVMTSVVYPDSGRRHDSDRVSQF